MNLRHITRFTYKFTNFQGWRVAIRRHGYTLTRYFSDRQYEDEQIAYQQALQFRDKVLAELAQNPGNELAVLTSHSSRKKKAYPAGLKPNNTQQKEEAGTQDNCSCACSIRSNRVMQSVIRNVGNRLKLDTASIVKLSIYLFTIQYGYATPGMRNLSDTLALHEQAIHSKTTSEEDASDFLQRIIEELEREGRKAGLPNFEEFATGKTKRVTAAEEVRTMSSIAPQPGRRNRQATSYFNHFYASRKQQAIPPIPPYPYLRPLSN